MGGGFKGHAVKIAFDFFCIQISVLGRKINLVQSWYVSSLRVFFLEINENHTEYVFINELLLRAPDYGGILVV